MAFLTNAVDLSSYGSFWLHFLMTLPMDTLLLGQDAAWSLSSLNQKRSVFISKSTVYYMHVVCCSKIILKWCIICTLGGSTLGHSEKPTSDELWQAKSLSALLLWEGHNAEGKTSRLPFLILCSRSQNYKMQHILLIALKVCFFLLHRLLVRGTSTSLCATPRPFSLWLFQTTRGQTLRLILMA